MFMEEYKSVLKNHPRWIFASVVGSHNYGTSTEHSDVDLKVMCLPTFEEFYNNKFDRTSDAGPDSDVDYTCHPLHEYIRHCFKGNMNFWEPFFSNHLIFNSRFVDADYKALFCRRMRNAVIMNYMANFRATRGMALEKYKKFQRGVHLGNGDTHTELQIDLHNKEIQHAIRLLEFLVHYIKTDEIELDLTDNLDSKYPTLREEPDPIHSEVGEYLFETLDGELSSLEYVFKHFDATYYDQKVKVMDGIQRQIFELIRKNV